MQKIQTKAKNITTTRLLLLLCRLVLFFACAFFFNALGYVCCFFACGFFLYCCCRAYMLIFLFLNTRTKTIYTHIIFIVKQSLALKRTGNRGTVSNGNATCGENVVL